MKPVARKSGFTYVCERSFPHAHRGRDDITAWFGTLAATDSRSEKPGWPSSQIEGDRLVR
jgi:hypothetical protein